MNTKQKKSRAQIAGIVLYMLTGAACGILIVIYMEKLEAAGM